MQYCVSDFYVNNFVCCRNASSPFLVPCGPSSKDSACSSHPKGLSFDPLFHAHFQRLIHVLAFSTYE
jgi:hypothetical protein